MVVISYNQQIHTYNTFSSSPYLYYKDYLDELMRILRGSFLELEIVFVKEITPEICTIIACVPQIIDIYNDVGDDDGGYID